MNKSIRNVTKQTLSAYEYKLYNYTFDYQNQAGEWQKQEREVYDRGNSVTILLYNKAQNTVILTKQFRLPTYINGNSDGRLLETCAGLLEGQNAEDSIRKEVEEETGYRITQIQKVFQAYMSPGAVTEMIYFFIADYSAAIKVSEGGGLKQEQESIEVIELGFDKAYAMLQAGEIRDAKTLILLQYAKLNGLLK